MAAKDRRERFHHFDKNYDPLLSFNVDEYLMQEHSRLSAKQRKSVRVLCQNNQDFDWTSVKDQIDQCANKIYDDSNSRADGSA